MSIIMQNKAEQSNSIKIISKTLTYNPKMPKLLREHKNRTVQAARIGREYLNRL